MKYIASCSFGKDSVAMCINLIKKQYPLDYIIFYDTGMEFKAIYDTRDKFLKLLKDTNIEYIELKPKNTFLYDMLEREVKTRDGSQKIGYKWCGGRVRWGTSMKIQAFNNFYKEIDDEIIEYIGIAFDEQDRIDEKKYKYKTKCYPLIDWKMTEAGCLAYCYVQGYLWEEEGLKLYDILPRVSCWCCKNKNIKELRNYYHYIPSYWEKLKDIQKQIEEPMKGQWSVQDLEERFKIEDKRLKEGKPIHNKDFFQEVRNKLNK